MPANTRGESMIISRPVRDEEFRKAWSARHDFCQACGLHVSAMPFPGISTHHLVKAGRSDEGTNLLRLCGQCHSLAELLTVKVGGTTLPTLGWKICCTLKMLREPEEFDCHRLATLARRLTLDLPPIPLAIETLYRQNRPWDQSHFASGNFVRPSE
jgi:hypothetical protein